MQGFYDPLANETKGNTAVIVPVLLCPSGKSTQNLRIKPSGVRYAVTSFGRKGGTQSHPPASTSGDGIFADCGPPITTPSTVQHGLVRIRDVVDGTTNRVLLGERNYVDQIYDQFFSSGATTNPMGAGVSGLLRVGSLD